MRSETTQYASRITVGIFMAAIVLLAVIFARPLINRALCQRFYQDYLSKWRLALDQYAADDNPFPVFSGNNHVVYMERLCQMMNTANISPPKSNTARPYTYRLLRLDTGIFRENIFVLCLTSRIYIYGLSNPSFRYVDQLADGQTDPERGRLKGRPGQAPNTYIGIL